MSKDEMYNEDYRHPDLILNIQEYSIQNGPGIRTTVFVKGCPMKCTWCASPESIKKRPDIGFNQTLCNLCGDCIEICNSAAFSLVNKTLIIDREKCNVCGDCISICSPQAFTLWGQELPIDEVFNLVNRSRPYFVRSGGGVTVSGGEPLSQPAFVIPFLKRCYDSDIHTCVDTTGFGSKNVLEKLARVTDLFLYDLKHMDSEIHKKATGVSNKRILENAQWIAENQIPMIARIPLIPGINNSVENIRATAEFVKSLGTVKQIDILPYHTFATNKYSMLGKTYPMGELPACSVDTATDVKRIITDEYGFNCVIGG